MKINYPLVKGTLVKLKPYIYAVAIEDAYDRAMLFCRYQEFYESPIKKIRGKVFSLEYLMKLYREHYKKGVFTYPEDWAGYNIPSHILDKARSVFNENEYDGIMDYIINHCETDAYNSNNGANHPWYLIGADKLDSRTMNHELAHGLYYTNKEYKANCDNLIANIKPSHYNKVKKQLLKIGYFDSKKIIDDEIQAFFSTGLYRTFNSPEIKQYTKPFIANLKKFMK